MIATVAFSAHACGDTAWKGEDVTISIKDSSNEVIASAVYDFASDPMQFTSGKATLELAYAIGQYWRASDQIETKSTSMVVQKGATRTVMRCECGRRRVVRTLPTPMRNAMRSWR